MGKYGYKPLTDIGAKITQILHKLDIPANSSVELAIQNKQNFYSAITEYKGEKVFFKARIADHRVLQQWGKKFRNERRFLRTLTKKYPDSSLLERFPGYIRSQINGVEWLICRYVEAKPLGSSPRSYDNPKREEIAKIIELLKDIQDFPIADFCHENRWTKDIKYFDADYTHDHYRKIIRQRLSIIKPILSKELLEEGNQILLDNMEMLDKYCAYLCHGDFHPANILVDKKAVAIDWERLNINNPAYDITSLWLRMTEHLMVRRLMLNEYIKVLPKSITPEIFADLFRLNLIANLPAEICDWTMLLRHSTDPKLSRLAQKSIELSKTNFLKALNGVSLGQYE